eukprot:3910000-Amphidinium_carterae.1
MPGFTDSGVFPDTSPKPASKYLWQVPLAVDLSNSTHMTHHEIAERLRCPTTSAAHKADNTSPTLAHHVSKVGGKTCAGSTHLLIKTLRSQTHCMSRKKRLR